MGSNQAWLDRYSEEVIDPEVPVVDCHHHFYKDRSVYFTWQSDYLAEHLAADLQDGHKVMSTVCVECGYGYRDKGPESLHSLGETEFMLTCAESFTKSKSGDTDVCKGIIPFIDLRLGDAVEEVILAHREIAGDRLKGIRQMAAKQLSANGMDRSESLLLDRRFQQGLRLLKSHHLTFDVWILHPQLPELFEVARRFPDTTFVLDHLGAPVGVGPYATCRDEVARIWQKDMKQLAELHNVVVKLGGLNMSLGGFDWHMRPAPPGSDELLEATRDYYMHTIDFFSPQRCMFESNFPVDKISVSYRTLWNAYKKISREFNSEEANSMLSTNAIRIYRL